MSEEIKYKKQRFDIEAGSSRHEFSEDDDGGSGPFDIVRTKGAPVHQLRRWREAALVLNPSRRFRYTLDLKKEEKRRQLIAKIRTNARAAVLFQDSGKELSGPVASNATISRIRPVDFGISSEELVAISKEQDISLLRQNGGVSRVAEKLKSNLDNVVSGIRKLLGQT